MVMDSSPRTEAVSIGGGRRGGNIAEGKRADVEPALFYLGRNNFAQMARRQDDVRSRDGDVA
jgi:hypothetical protein